MNYLRPVQQRAALLTLIAAPETPPRSETRLDGENPFAGLVVANLSPAVTEELGLAGGLTGVVVTKLEDGPARRLGFRPGDVIAELNGEEIDSVGNLAKMLSDGADYWLITVNRKGRLVRLQLEN